MQTFDGIFKALGGYTGVAAAAGVSPGTASSWKSRKSIPAEYWTEIAGAARRQDIKGVTLEDFAAALAVRAQASRDAPSDRPATSSEAA